MRLPSPVIALITLGWLVSRATATNVGVNTVEQPVNLGALADPASIPLGPVPVECNYNYGLHAVISQPRPCQFGAMEWKAGTELDQNLAHVFGIIVDPKDSTQVPALPVTLRVKAWPAPAYSPYTREQVMAATLQCLLRGTYARPKLPLRIEVVCDAPEDKSWADKFAGNYITEPEPDGPPVEPTPVPGCHVETNRFGIARVVFPGVTKTAAAPARPPVLIPFSPPSEYDPERPTWLLLPVWAGDTFENPLEVLGRPYTLYYDLFNPSDSESPQINALFDRSTALHWSIGESPEGTSASLMFGAIDPGNLAAFLQAVVFTVQPTASKPLTITLIALAQPPDFFQECLDAGGWILGKQGGEPSITGSFVLDPDTTRLVKGTIPGIKIVSDGKKLLRMTAPTVEEEKATGSLEAKREQVKDDAEALGAALETYRVTSGNYPTEQQGLAALVEKPRLAPPPRRWLKLMEKVPTDPWGGAYRLVIREKNGKPLAIIVSQGPDATTTNDDIQVEVPAGQE
ncbi:type II secretion system protein GspG [Luteolibacter soli]|uniref:Type II secretion system protein GspG n=1 Tax=Luteolibacter soli TaxID=3135280 RepID=A0ABU9AVK0_9BACT